MPYQLIHASCVAVNGRGVLLTGPAGAGKSGMALQLIGMGAELVADDQTELRVENGQLLAGPPAAIAGLIEARYAGLLRLPYRASAPVVLAVELVPDAVTLERLPEPDRVFLLDRQVRRLRLPSYENATPAKIRAALLYELAEQAVFGEKPHDG